MSLISFHKWSFPDPTLRIQSLPESHVTTFSTPVSGPESEQFPLETLTLELYQFYKRISARGVHINIMPLQVFCLKEIEMSWKNIPQNAEL